VAVCQATYLSNWLCTITNRLPNGFRKNGCKAHPRLRWKKLDAFVSRVAALTSPAENCLLDILTKKMLNAACAVSRAATL
jgi:hypothetical protein